jgi:hypothetical protein
MPSELLSKPETFREASVLFLAHQLRKFYTFYVEKVRIESKLENLFTMNNSYSCAMDEVDRDLDRTCGPSGLPVGGFLTGED